LRAGARALREVRPNLWVWTPPVLWPFFQIFRTISKLNNRRLARRLQEVITTLKFTDPVLWLHTPYSADLIDSIKPAKTIYECVDDYAAAKGLIRSSCVRAMEDTTFRRADLTIVTTEPLARLAERVTPVWRLSPNACDVEFFARAHDARTQVHETLRDCRRPIFGFIGAVAYWVDCDLLAQLALARPDATVAVVGPVRVGIRQYRHIPNLLFLGEQRYQELPELLRGFDVCLNPYKTDDVARGASPLKLYEYLATGKPIVSTPMPEAERFAEVVAVADTAASFIAACNSACEETPAQATSRCRRQMQIAATQTWDIRFAEIDRWLEPIIAPSTRSRPIAARHIEHWTHKRAPETQRRHVVINALSIPGPELAGGFTFLTSLLEPMIARHRETEFTIVVTQRAKQYFSWPHANLTLAVLPNVIGRGPVRALYERYGIGELLKTLHADAYYLPYGLLPRQRVCPQIVTLQTFHYFLADDHDLLGAHAPWRRFYERIRTTVFVKRLCEDLQTADRLIAVSQATADAYIKYANAPANTMQVVLEGVAPRFCPEADAASDITARLQWHLPRRYLLFVGELAPSKNLPALLNAYAAYAKHTAEPAALVLVGPDPRGLSASLRQQASELGIGDHLHLTGFVEPAALPAIYRGADVVALLSPCEPFGLPALEAMACGTPLIVANSSGLAEVVGDGAITVDPQNADRIGAILSRLTEDQDWRTSWIARGRARARAFTWPQTAERTYAIIAEAAGWADLMPSAPETINRIRQTVNRETAQRVEA
jgi:glycosyltransferase involved in cell wall biosynthesis